MCWLTVEPRKKPSTVNPPWKRARMKAIRIAILNRILDSITPHESDTAKLSSERARAIPVIVMRSMVRKEASKIVKYYYFYQPVQPYEGSNTES